MKKLPRLSPLQKLNRLLKKNSWAIYLGFLDTLLSTTDLPESQELLSLLRQGRFTELVEVADRISSTEYRTATEHRLCNQLSAVIRKYPFPSNLVQFDPRKRAMEVFLSSEHKCKLVNRRFQLFRTLRSPHESDLSQARSWIQYVLGELNLREVWDLCSFGPGASIGVHGYATNTARKLLADRWTVSPSAYDYAMACTKVDVHIWELVLSPNRLPYNSLQDQFNTRFAEKARLVDYNKIAFVPKTVKTERTIAVEPLWNGYIQLGVGEAIRKRLKRVDIDLKDQTKNQKLARKGSLGDSDDPYVTIDLSSASDSVTIELCRDLLPPDWFSLMNQLRSKSWVLEGDEKPHLYEKFTTMGNGFCFPLETLIFASLCHVANKEMRIPVNDFSVYGDDIIVRQSVANRLLGLLRLCGFTTNVKKTFLSGPFRESCGADWFEGEDVRPLNLDFAFENIQSIFKFCNAIRSKPTWEGVLGPCLEELEACIPLPLRYMRPYKGNVETALEVPMDVFMSSPHGHWNKCIQAWSWKELLITPVQDKPVQMIAGYNVVLMRGALSGSFSSAPFAERRKTRTKTRRLSFAGGTSLFLPVNGRWSGTTIAERQEPFVVYYQ